MPILALDIQTSSVGAAVFDVESGQPTGDVVRVAVRLDRPTPDAAELPADRIWSAVAAAARQASRGHEGVEALGFCCASPALVPLDGADEPVAPVRTDRDRRARPAARQAWAAVGDEFLQTVGCRPLPGAVSALGWRQQLTDDPYLNRRVRRYLHLNGWLGLRLTGEAAFDPANASATGLFGTLTDQRWSERWCQYFQVEPAWLPPVRSGRATLGTLRAAAAAELGVAAGLPVKFGTDDVSSAMLAAGMRPGDLLHIDAGTEWLAAFTPQPLPGVRRLVRRFGAGGDFVHLTHCPVGAAAIEWLRALCFAGQCDEEFYQRTVPAAQARGTRVTLDPAFLDGDPLEIEAHRASFRDVTLATDGLDLLAAILDAVQRHYRTALRSLGVGENFGRVFLSGNRPELLRRLLPEYGGPQVQVLCNSGLRGVARLFAPDGGAAIATRGFME